MMLVLTLAFSQIFGARTPGYAAYVLSGLVAWTFFSQTTSAAMVQLVWGSSLMHRIYLPRTAFAVSSVGTGVVNLVLSLVPLVAVMLLSGVPLTFNSIWLPLAILLLAIFALGVGLAVSAIAAYFPDVSEMYQIVLTAWMYLTPIIYPENIVPESYRWWLFNLNPMYHLIKLFRLPLYYGLTPSPARWATAAIVAVGFFLIGWVLFTSRSDDLAYRV
jgi:ABC-type polysaccharide/polyol phosphate export permease